MARLMRRLACWALMSAWLAFLTFATYGCTVTVDYRGRIRDVPGEVYFRWQRDFSRQQFAPDIHPDAWYAQSANALGGSGILPPTADGGFHPEAPLTVGEGIAIFAKLVGIAGRTDSTDVAVAKAIRAELVDGPVFAERRTTRMEIARMLSEALGLTPAPASGSVYPFADPGSLSAEDMGMIMELHDLGIFRGFPEENGAFTFRPDSLMSRAEIAVVINRLMSIVEVR